MIQRPDKSSLEVPRVYVLPIFEVKENVIPPKEKTGLQEMLRKKEAFPFHKSICGACHGIPLSNDWQNDVIKSGISVFNIAKRKGPTRDWEPIYIGTNYEPLYDERLTWEGKSDKMTQMYIFCIKDYEFHVLDTAFLVHRPGIKKYYVDRIREGIAARQSNLIHKVIHPEYKRLYGIRDGC